jgi:hypothetical protein
MVLVRPELPPDLAWKRLFENMLPSLLSKKLPLSVSLPPFMMAKRSWEIAFDIDLKFKFPSLDEVVEVQRPVITSKSRAVARTLVFDVTEASDPPVFSASPVSVQKKRCRKAKAPVVQSTNRRFTRSCLKLDGFRPKPIVDGCLQPKKKQRAKFLLEEVDDVQQMTDIQLDKDKGDSSASGTAREQEEVQIPKTPIAVMQSVGIKLGIDPKKLTKEQLEADPKEKASSSVEK